MKKTATTIFLVVFILACGLFIFLKLGALGPQNDYFNSHWRLKFDRSSALRQILGLHDYGDARSDYLGSRYQKITIEVDTMADVRINRDALARLTAAVQNITGKPTDYFVSDRDIPTADLTDAQLAELVKTYRNTESSGQTASLYLLLADGAQDQPKQLGLTFQESGIVLYQKALESFTKDSQLTLPNYEFSTALHEFGHQMGLEHNDEPGCLMNAKAETSDEAAFNPDLVVMDFCPLEQQQIAAQQLQSR